MHIVYTTKVTTAPLPSIGREFVVLKFDPWGGDPVFEWDEHNQEKFWRHGILDFEVEECFQNPYCLRPHRKAKSDPEVYGDRYVVLGVTDGGRNLLIVVQFKGGNVVRPITGWEN